MILILNEAHNKELLELSKQLTKEETEMVKERVHRQVQWGQQSLAEATLSTLASIKNMRIHAKNAAEKGKPVDDGMKHLFEKKMLEVVTPKDQVEIKDVEDRDKYGSAKNS